jgi:hypothetical protein
MEAIFCSLPKRVVGERALLLFFLNQKLHAELNGWRQIINNEKKWVATGE